LVRRCQEKVALDSVLLHILVPSKAPSPLPLLTPIHIAILCGKKASVDLPHERLIKEGALRGP